MLAIPPVASGGQRGILPLNLWGTFPAHINCSYTVGAVPDTGDLCYIEASGRRLYGYFRARAPGATFSRPGAATVYADVYRVIGVLHPVPVISLEFV